MNPELLQSLVAFVEEIAAIGEPEGTPRGVELDHFIERARGLRAVIRGEDA